MSSYIEAVKNNVKELRDDLVKQYKGCDIRFAFVRYTDYDVKSGRTTFIDFTTLVYKPFSIYCCWGGGGVNSSDFQI